jgi:hypothetical protein
MLESSNLTVEGHSHYCEVRAHYFNKVHYFIAVGDRNLLKVLPLIVLKLFNLQMTHYFQILHLSPFIHLRTLLANQGSCWSGLVPIDDPTM